MTLNEAETLVHQKLTPKRVAHVAGVATTAKKLALCFGAPPEKAELAGWLHDIVKEEPPKVLLQLMLQDVIIAGSTNKRPLPIWHGPCGAIYAKHNLGINDEEVLSAIACHTTGKLDMSLLDKVIFLADVISPERNFDCVDEIRELAKTNLDAAVIAAMHENVRYITRVGKVMDKDTLGALRYLEKTAECPVAAL